MQTNDNVVDHRCENGTEQDGEDYRRRPDRAAGRAESYRERADKTPVNQTPGIGGRRADRVAAEEYQSEGEAARDEEGKGIGDAGEKSGDGEARQGSNDDPPLD